MLLLGAVPLAAQSLDRQEQRLRESITAAREEQIVYLQRVVDIPSSTLNFAGVRKVGAVFRASFDSLGFTTSWAAVTSTRWSSPRARTSSARTRWRAASVLPT